MLLFMALFFFTVLIGIIMDYYGKHITVIHYGSIKIKIDDNHIYLIVCISLMFLLCALRDQTIGTDTPTYISTFLNSSALMTTIGGENKFEIGYIIFVKFLRLFSDKPQVYIFATSLVGFVGTYIFIERNCKGSYSISILIFMAFLYYVYFSAIRQSMALAIAMNSFPYICNKKWVKASLLIILGASFHYTVLVLLVFIPLCLTKWTRNKIVLAVFLSVGAILLFDRIVDIVLMFFPIYRRYWESGMMRVGGTHGGLFAKLAAAISIYAFIKLMRNRNVFPDRQEEIHYIVALTGSVFCVFVNILGMSNGIFSRITRFFIPFVMVLTVSTYEYYVKKYKVIFYFGIVFLTGTYFYVRMKGDIYQIIPYKFCFEGI